MADIVAADVTGTVLYRTLVGKSQNNQSPIIDVAVKLVIDPGTTDAYPTGGIPLTNLFTAGTAQDTGIDVLNPIFSMGEIVVRKTGALTSLTKGTFNNGGITAATQTLVLANGPGVLATITASIASVGAPVTSFTDAANGFVTAGFKAGDVIIASNNATAAANGTAVVSAVAAGTLTVHATTLTATAAASMTIQTIFRPVAVQSEYTNSDVTLLTGPTGGADTTMTAYMLLRGRLRPNTTFAGLDV